MLYTKYENSRPFSFRQDLRNCILKTFLWPCDNLMQPIKTILAILVGDHPGTIPVEFGRIPISSSREEVVWTFPYIIQRKIVTPRVGSILTPGGPLDDAIYQIWKLWALLFQTKSILKIAFWKPIFLPCDLLMQPIRTIWTISVGDHSGTIPVEFGQNSICSSREEDIWTFLYINQC